MADSLRLSVSKSVARCTPLTCKSVFEVSRVEQNLKHGQKQENKVTAR